MKNVIIPIALILLLPVVGVGENNDVNVLNYYAVTNSIDGQPLIDRINVMRFLPVFAMREYVDSVHITIFFGSKIYSRSAVSIEGGRYWEVMLPQFRLGEAIQRIEVEVQFSLPVSYQNKIDLVKRKYDHALEELRKERESAEAIKKQLPVLEQSIKSLSESLLQTGDKDTAKTRYATQMKESNDAFKDLGITSNEADGLRIPFAEADSAGYFQKRADLLERKNISSPDTVNMIHLLIEVRTKLVQEYQKKYIELATEEQRLKKTLRRNRSLSDSLARTVLQSEDRITSLQSRYLSEREILTREIEKEIEVGLTDTMYVGPAVKKSDLVIDANFKKARILYRNYKTALRKMLALDPAERVGIFRVRYIPFAIVGIKESPMSLRGQFSQTPTTTFEVGLSFGDAITPGDEFVPTEFSLRRLGVAFAVTQKLFKDDADIMAIAVTYDFNSYASIGYGANFAHSVVRGYASLGINKKAFEQVVAALGKLFE